MRIVKFENRDKLKVYGKQSKFVPVADHITFLNGIFTNDIKNLLPNQFNYNLMLNEKGFPIDDFFVFCFNDYFILDFEGRYSDKVERFDRLKLSLKVYFENIPLNHYFIWEEGSSEFIKECFNIEKLPEKFSFIVKDGSIIAKNPLRIGIDGFDIFTQRELPVNTTQEEFENLRVESCIPKINMELREGIIPLETNIWRAAINFNKGCYTGQEVVARIFYRGKPPRKMVKLKLSKYIEPGLDIFFKDKKVGIITSINKYLTSLGFMLNSYIDINGMYYTANNDIEIKLISKCTELDI